MFPFILHRSSSDSSSSADMPRDSNSTDSPEGRSHRMATTDRPSTLRAESALVPSLVSQELLVSDSEIQAMCESPLNIGAQPRDSNSTDSPEGSSHRMATTDRPSTPRAESTLAPSLASEELLASDSEIHSMCAQPRDSNSTDSPEGSSHRMATTGTPSTRRAESTLVPPLALEELLASDSEIQAMCAQPRDSNCTDSPEGSSHRMATTDRPSTPRAESTLAPPLALEELLASDSEIQAMCAQPPQPRSGTPQITKSTQQPKTASSPSQQGTSEISDPAPGPSHQPVPAPPQQPAPPRQQKRRDRSPLQVRQQALPNKRHCPFKYKQKPFKRPLLEPREAALPLRSPDDFWHYLIDHHPWARHVRPRQIRRDEIAEQQISNDLPVDLYRHVPHLGYAAVRFVHSLFPRTPPNLKTVRTSLAFIEFPNLEDAIIFRDKSQEVIEATLRGDDELVQQERKMAPKNVYSSILLPPKVRGSYPVLYQVAAIGQNYLVLEAKDFFVFMPDRLELHCILLDPFSLNIENNTYGYDRHLISVKDFVWVYEVSPTTAAVRSPARCLELARIPRTAALERNTEFFFRAALFAFVTPAVWTEPHLGVVLKLVRKGEAVKDFKMALEGVPEAVTITRSICEFEWPNVQEDEVLIAQSRKNVSCAVRFSEPPASITAQDWLRRQVEHFCPAHPDEGIVPMRVRKARQEDIDWFYDRTGEFKNFVDNHPQALRRMSKVFSMACAALAALQSLDDDNRTHRVTATVPSVSSHPLQLQLILRDMSSPGGRKASPRGSLDHDVWWFTKFEIDEAEFQEETRELRVTLITYTQTEHVLRKAIRTSERGAGNTTFLDHTVKLGRTPANANPAFEAVSRMQIYKELEQGGTNTTIIDIAYGAHELGCKTAEEAEGDEDVPLIDSITLHGRQLQLTRDQQDALTLANSRYPLIAIQAAFGTGKTVVGACVAIRQALAGQRVIITASTNTAVAQFANTILGFKEAQEVGVTRFVAEAIAFDTDAPVTFVDLHEILKMIGTVFQQQLTTREKETCQVFTQGRIRYEKHRRERCTDLSEQEREDFMLAEKDVSRNLQDMVDIMFRRMDPKIVCITTASLLNTTDKDGLFKGYLDRFNLIICDEASQVPEPVFMAITARIPQARHIYIGDIHQLEPYARCTQLATPARLGAQSIMNVLQKATAVPVRSLVTTFRAHPALTDLPNTVCYKGSLLSGVTAADRHLLLDIMDFPNRHLPFMFVNVNGTSVQSASHSHYNERERMVCEFLVTTLIRRGVAAKDIVIITFYKDQYRHLEEFVSRAGANLSTVDTVQGREKDVVIVLTTNTHFNPEGAGSLGDPRRMNVALTRCRHGQFVLGNRKSLEKVPFWKTVLDWSQNHNAIVPSASLGRYLRA